MPSKRSHRKKKGSKMSKSITTKQGKIPYMERQIQSLKRSVKTVKQRCYTDDGAALANVTSTAAISKLFTVPGTGATVNTRIGDSVYVYAMLFSLVITGTEQSTLLASTDLYNVIGYKVGYSIKPDGVGLPTGSGSANAIFDTASAFAGSNAGDAPVGIDALDAVRILKHGVVTVAGAEFGTSSSAPAPFVRDIVVHRKHLFKFRNPIKCTFNSSSDVAGSFNTFLPWLAIISDSGSSPHPQYSWSTRVYYYA